MRKLKLKRSTLPLIAITVIAASACFGYQQLNEGRELNKRAENISKLTPPLTR